jgi:hypothetical protein
MNRTLASGLGMMLLALGTAPASAQVPAGVPGAAVQGAAVAQTAAPAQFNIFEMFNCTKMKAECKECLCATPLGQMANNMTGMFGTFTGGLIPPLCPPVKAEDLAKVLADPNKSSAEKEAAKVAALEAQAKARAAAMRFFGTVDCERFKAAGIDVAGELIKGLNDTNECVRLAAAEALGNGCCCGEDTIEALAAVASGAGLIRRNEAGERKFVPDAKGRINFATAYEILPEKCLRVRAAARFALERCLCCFVQKEPVGVRKKSQGEGPPPKPKGEGDAFNQKGANGVVQVRFDEPRQQGEGMPAPREKVVQDAQQVLQGCGTIDTPHVQSHDCSVFGFCKKAFGRHGHQKRQIIRTTILDTTPDCHGKLVPVGADANAVVQPHSRMKDNFRNMMAPVERQPVQNNGAMPQSTVPQGAPATPSQGQPGGAKQPIIIYEAPTQSVYVQTPAPQVVVQPTVSQPLPLPPVVMKQQPQPLPTVIVAKPQPQPLPTKERRVTNFFIPTQTPAPAPTQERRITSYQVMPQQ